MAVAKKSPRDLPKKADNNTAAAPQSLPKPVSSVGVSSVLPGLQGGLSASEEQVRRRAYEIYVSQGRPEGRAEQHWLQAEAELHGRSRSA